MREIIGLLSELVCQIDMTDTIIITLSSLSIMCFFVENINELQLESLKLLTNIFTRYSKHRQLVFDDILSSLIKLHSNKRNARMYKCFNGDSIQMFSALLLQLIQCEVTSFDFTQRRGNEIVSDSTTGTTNETTFEEKETYLINTYEESIQTAKKFLSLFFAKCKTKQSDSDFRPIFENFIQDLLTTVNKPEWPVSESILNLVGIILVNQIQNEQNDVGSRVNSLEYLGQIVAQLRRDSLEYQKYPEKIHQVLAKLNSSVINEDHNGKQVNYSDPTSHDPTEGDIFQMQKSMIAYLDSLAASDDSVQFAQYFLIGQWLKELNAEMPQKQENEDYGQDLMEKQMIGEENRKRLYSLLEKKMNKKNSGGGYVDEAKMNDECRLLEQNEAFILSKYLCSLKKTLDKNFDFYLINILSLSGGSEQNNTPTQVRSKAIKCLSLIIEADPAILLKQKVFACVEANFLHQTISVREASVDLIGRFITLKPELTNHYYKLLSERILDVGVSVRKRAIKIFRDVCLNQPDFEHLSEICVKILRRLNDEDAIKKLVIDTFYLIWFAPIGSNRDQLMRRVLNIVDVVSEFNLIANNTQSVEIFEQLFSSLIVQPDNKSASNTGQSSNESGLTTTEQEQQASRSKEVLKSCKLIVDCLIENVLNTEANTSSPQAYKRLVSCFSTLYLLSKIKPENFINHAETLLPYLTVKSTNANDNQIINSAAKILECVVPLLNSPSNSFLITLEESLCKLIFQGGTMIVSSCMSCLGTVVNKLTKNYKLAADCFLKFYKNAAYLKQSIKVGRLEPLQKPLVYRMLFTLGLLSKHFDVESDEFIEFKICTKQDIFNIFLFFIKGFDGEVQFRALIGLGSFLTRYSEYMMKDEIKKLYLDYIQGSNVPMPLKSQVFLNLTDYLSEEDKRNFRLSSELTKHNCKDDLKEMQDVQSGMASTIIQAYLKPILDSYITHNPALRVNIFNCLSMILTQGLVYPIECVPYLIAMTTDIEKKIQVKALTHLVNLQKAHPGFVQSKSIAGVNISFLLHKTIAKFKAAKQSSEQIDTNPSPSATESVIIRGISDDGEVLSLNHHLYSLLRQNRSYRRAFLQQLLKMFDRDSSLLQTSLSHMLYISDNLAYFPYQLIDEPLYLIHQIDIIISVSGINLLQTFKENLLNDSGGSEGKTNNKSLNSQFNQDFVDFNQDCPVEANENNCPIVQSHHTGGGGDDDDEELFENVYKNLPNDLKPLKDCMYKAQGCCLLLIIKQFLKEIYSISDSKIQSYSPTDSAKVNDRPITSRRMNKKFNPKSIMDYMRRLEDNNETEEEIKNNLVKEYLEVTNSNLNLISIFYLFNFKTFYF
jgi:cohesin loading factor subunit SCC2